MRALAIADVHGALDVYTWLVGQAEPRQADVVVIAGDLFAGMTVEEQREQGKEIAAILRKAPVPVLYIMGNDDRIPLGYEDKRVRHIHGKRFDCGSYNFVGYEYSLPFVGGPFEKPEEEIQKDLEAMKAQLDPSTVLVTHSPAHGTLDQVQDGSHVGSWSICSILDERKALAHIHGHIHECFGHDGKHFNVAAAAHRRAVIIELPSLVFDPIEAG